MEAFVPSYPDVERESFYRDIVGKYEFVDDEDVPERWMEESDGFWTEEDFSKQFFRYQTNIARFLSAKTIYDSLLVIHEMGTGKSGSAIATAYLVRSQDPSFRRVIVLANGKTQLNNFRQEVLLRLPFLYTKHADTTDPRVILRREGFVFDTYRVFARQLANKSKDDWRRLYDRSVIIMDEIHNLTSFVSAPSSSTVMTMGSSSLTNVRVYAILYDFVHALRTRKLLCLTGTPIRDKPQEIANVLNLVIPVSNRLPPAEEFRQTYLDTIKTVNVLGDATLTLYDFRRSRVEEFTNRIRGYVSYLKKSLPRNITVEYLTNPNVPTTGFLDHFRVYGNVMNEPQNTMYLEAFVQDLEGGGAESSSQQQQQRQDDEDEEEEGGGGAVLAYSRSKQVGLFAFPRPGEYIRPVYEKKGGRLMRTLTWTKEMRTLFPKDLSLDAKFARISKYSTIYASILRQIIDHPSELTYVYSFLKSGVGIYVLASIMVEYFQFEIVRKVSEVRTKATNRRRVLILNHDFVTDTDLREMVEWFNRDENAFGEYIQVVIGTKQTKEGITLKNIQQIHIVQPDWNYADISQAIGRGIRVGSHRALLEKVAQVRVRVYQHASIPIVDDEMDLSYSIDMEQYRRSEMKDRNIKMIERRLLQASWDCELNRARNTGMIDGSRECEYTLCEYTCEGIPADIQTSYDTFNAYYSDMARRIMSNHVMQTFRKDYVRSSISLLQSGRANNLVLMETTLSDMMMNSTWMVDARRDRGFLRYDHANDVYFLVGDRNAYSYYDAYYTQRPVFYMPTRFNDVHRHLFERKFADVVNGAMRRFYEDPESHDEVRTTILQSPVRLQEVLVETAIRDMLEKGASNPFYEFLLGHYQSQARLEKRGDVYISTILPDVERQLDTTSRPWTWTDVAVDTMPAEPTGEENAEFVRKFITENPYGYYGILEISAIKTVFKIRDVRNQELVFGSNKAKIPKGEVCAGSFSRKKSGLIEILLALKWRPPSSSDDEGATMPVDALRRAFASKDKSKLLQDMSLTDVETIPEDTLRAIYALSTEKIPQLCALARKRFVELDLMQEKRV